MDGNSANTATTRRQAERCPPSGHNLESRCFGDASVCPGIPARKYGLHFFHGQHFQVEGYQIAGLGYSNPTPLNSPGEYTEEELSRRLAAFAELNPLVLVCHCPPLATPLDQVRPGVHAGSRAAREFIGQHQPEYFFCGHIHEAEGASAILGRTRGFNTGERGYWLEL